MPPLHPIAAPTFMVSLLALLLAARLCGELMERLKQPALVGEIIGGILVGPVFLHLAAPSPELNGIKDLCVFLLVLLAGLEMDPRELRPAFKGRGSWVAVMGFFLPLALGVTLGYVFRFDNTRAIFLGLCIAITALPVSIRILMDLNMLQTDVGRRIISAAVANDVFALFILGVILDVKNTQNTSWIHLLKSMGLTGAKTAVVVAVLLLAYRLLRFTSSRFPFAVPFSQRAMHWLVENLKGKETLFALTLIFVMAFATLTEAIGFHFVMGTFFGGMFISREFLGAEEFEEVSKTTSSIVMGFLSPVYFAALGLDFSFEAFHHLGLLGAILAAAFIGKILGGYWGGRLAGLPKRDCQLLGVGLNARGVMELIIAQIALQNGFIEESLFSILVLMGIFTTLVTPSLLQYIGRRPVKPVLPLEPIS